MIQEGQVVLFSLPSTDQSTGKLRPALVLRKCPGPHADWLICMISSQLRRGISGIDEVIATTDVDFAQSGLKLTSVVRITRLAVVAADVLRGTIGDLPNERVDEIRKRLVDWISGHSPASGGKDGETRGQNSY